MSDRNPDGTFAKGHKGFKPKGSRNRFTVAMMNELLNDNLHPMQELKKLYQSTDDDKVKFQILKEMLSFGNDKQFVEVQETDAQTGPRTDEELLRELYSELKPMFEGSHKNP
ncbi:TPA: hypothetical protein I7778_14045 [Vibrio vulnificus]|nr:hypothetical protein [Vibrio vulnificus]